MRGPKDLGSQVASFVHDRIHAVARVFHDLALLDKDQCRPIVMAVPGHDATGLDGQFAEAELAALDMRGLLAQVDGAKRHVGNAHRLVVHHRMGVGFHLVDRTFAGPGENLGISFGLSLSRCGQDWMISEFCSCADTMRLTKRLARKRVDHRCPSRAVAGIAKFAAERHRCDCVEKSKAEASQEEAEFTLGKVRIAPQKFSLMSSDMRRSHHNRVLVV
jgi:hypothetical protein